MAINVAGLTAYVDEQRLPLIKKAVLNAKSAQLFNLQTGCKGGGKTALNLLTTNVVFGSVRLVVSQMQARMYSPNVTLKQVLTK